jgi:hypothetical protein
MSQDYEVDLWSPQGPVTVLTDDECWELLRRWSFGRIAISVANRPEIFPINYAVDSGSVVIRTAPGTKLLGLTANDRIAFEADDHNQREAWSVSMTGTARIVESQAEIDRADRLPLLPWVPIEEFVYVRITPDSLSGRHIHRHVTIDRN